MICNVCKIDLDQSKFYFRKDTNKYRLNCKKCKPVNNKQAVANRTTKKCKHCGDEKQFSEYQKAGGGKWLQPYCKPCDAKRKILHTISNKDKIVEKRKWYYESNKEQILLKCKERNKRKPKKGRRLVVYKYGCKDYKNTEQYKISKRLSDKKYREDNKEKVKIKKKEYYEKFGREQARLWQQKQKADVGFVTKKRLRGRIYVALKRGVKSQSTMDLLGCSIDYFKEYFQSLFTEGMSWYKYMAGEIVIDHIKPCKLFDLTNSDEQKVCFNFKNLQPLWKIDNLVKGTSYSEEKISNII